MNNHDLKNPINQNDQQENPSAVKKRNITGMLMFVMALISVGLIGYSLYKQFVVHKDIKSMVYIKGNGSNNIESNGFIKSDDFLKKLVAEDCWTASTLHHKGNTERAGRTDTYVCVKSDSIFKASDRNVAEQRELKNHINDMSIEDFQERSAIIQMSRHKYCEVNKQSKFCS